MKFNVNVADFKKALSEVSKGLGNAQGIEAYSGIFIETNNDFIRLVATDSVVTVKKTLSAQVLEQGKELANAEMLSGIINQLNNNDTIEIFSENQTLHIKTSNVNIKQKCYNVNQYPQIVFDNDSVTTLTINATDFINAISKCMVCVSKEESRPALRGINLSNDSNSLVIASCDGYRMSKIKINVLSKNDNLDKFNVTVPLKAMTLIQSICSGSNEIALIFNKTKLKIETDTTLIISSLLNDKYIDINRIIPSSFTFSATIDTNELRQSLLLSQIVCKSEKQSIAKMVIEKTGESEGFKVVSNAQIADGEIYIKSKFDNADINNYSVGFNIGFVLDCLKTIKNNEIRFNFNGSTQPVIINSIEDDSYLFLILPVRIAE